MTIDELDEIVWKDLYISSPEMDVYKKCPHSAIRCDTPLFREEDSDLFENAAEKCNSIIRYYEDEHTARAYSVSAYEEGFVILYNKSEEKFYLYVLQEDDGAWFIDHWNENINNFQGTKTDFIARITEAISIFNANFNYKK